MLTMLAGADAVGSAMEGDGGALPVMADSGQREPPIWLQMSTVGEEATEWYTDLAFRYGVIFVDAPVLGTRQPAEQASSWCSSRVRRRPGRGFSRCSTRSATGRYRSARRAREPG